MNAPIESIDETTFESLGAHLQRERALRGMSIEEMSSTTRIPLASLRALEGDRLDELPGDVFTKGFLRAYAKALDIDEDRVLSLYERDRVATPNPLELVSVQKGGKGARRFGVMIAIVTLIILFTLAISIAFRPRQHRGPADLSSLETNSADLLG